MRLKMRVASASEAREYLKDNHGFLDDFTRKDLEYRLQKKGATKEEFLEFYAKQILDCTPEEIEAANKCIEEMNDSLEEKGYNLPDIGEIRLVKSTQAEECGAEAYTRGTQIFLCGQAFDIIKERNSNLDMVKRILWHELFHCLSRNDATFKKNMYSIIKFNVAENDLVIPKELKENMISNPDVVRHNAYGSLMIGDEPVEAFFVLTATKDFEKAGDVMFNSMQVSVVSTSDPENVHTLDEVTNLGRLFGENTDYVIDPEECLADNFSFALTKGRNGDYKTPEIVEAIIRQLEK